MALKSCHAYSLVVKAWFPNTVTTVSFQWENSYFNTISMLGHCVDERLLLGVLLLVMGLENWSKCPVAAARHFCGVFLRKNGSLGQLGGYRFLSFWWFTSFRFVRARRCVRKRLWTWISWGNEIVSVKWWQCQVKPIKCFKPIKQIMLRRVWAWNIWEGTWKCDNETKSHGGIETNQLLGSA